MPFQSEYWNVAYLLRKNLDVDQKRESWVC